MGRKPKNVEVDDQEVVSTVTNDDNDIIKQYGDVIFSAKRVFDNPPKILSIGPKLDIALGGGVPEGCCVVLTGPPKIGKTVTALSLAANAQTIGTGDKEIPKRKVVYANIEGRLKIRDMNGIRGLDLSDEGFEIIGSSKGHLLTGQAYLNILNYKINNLPYCIPIIDSFSALVSDAELTAEIGTDHVAAMHRYISNFTKKYANVLPINKVTLIGITHLMANIQKFGAGKATKEKSGNAIQYSQDVKLQATHKEPLKQGDEQIGQSVHWVVENSAIGPPGQKVVSHIKYGVGIWKEYEIAELAKDFSVVESKGTWLLLPNGQRIQGLTNLATTLENDRELYEDLRSRVFEMVGIK